MRTAFYLMPLLWGLAALAAPAPAAAQRSHIGAHAGYDFDRDFAVAGGQLSLPLNYVVELYPSVDVYLGEPGGKSLIGFNGDLKLRLNPGAPLQFYIGGGVNALRVHAGGTHTTDTGWDVFSGLESRFGLTHPYVEARTLHHDGSTLLLVAGLNITMF